MKKFTYAAIAASVGVVHMPLYSTRIPTADAALALDGPQRMASAGYAEHCVARNVSALDALRIPQCAWAPKNYPLIVPLRRLRATLLEAVDTIGAYSMENHEWVMAMKAMPDSGAALTAELNARSQLPAIAAMEALNREQEG